MTALHTYSAPSSSAVAMNLSVLAAVKEEEMEVVVVVAAAVAMAVGLRGLGRRLQVSTGRGKPPVALHVRRTSCPVVTTWPAR